MKYTVFCLIGILLISFCGCTVQTNQWKDTHKILGDGTYQIFTSHKNGEKIYGISNSLCGQCIVDEIIASKTKDNIMYVYGKFTGHNVYVSINLIDNYAKYFIRIGPNDVLGMTEVEKLKNSGTFEMLTAYDEFSNFEKTVFYSFSNGEVQ